MKLAELNKTVLAGRPSLVTGIFQEYTTKTHEKSGAYEQFGILIGAQVHNFTVFAPKGVSADKLPRPPFADKPGTPVVVIDAGFRVDGKFLRTSCKSIVAIEP